MSSYYRCTHFDIMELVDRHTYTMFGDSAWMFLRVEALVALDNIRNHFGVPVIVNDWSFGGGMEYRGFRPKTCDVGVDLSQHRFGNAFDIDVRGVSADNVRQEILRIKDDPIFLNITCMETGIPYVHFDCRNIPDRIRLIQG